MKRPFTLLLVALLGLSSAGFAAFVSHRNASFRCGEFDPPRAAPDFVLRGSDDAPLSLSRFRGKVILLEFGFTHCAQVCPVTLGKLTHVYEKLGNAAKDVQLVFVTVDPARDDTARLREFLGFFDRRFIGATGTDQEVSAVERAYGAFATKEPAADGAASNYGVHHSSSLYLIDRSGTLRGLLPFGATEEDVVHDIELVLR